jgi:hypothetical protein
MIDDGAVEILQVSVTFPPLEIEGAVRAVADGGELLKLVLIGMLEGVERLPVRRARRGFITRNGLPFFMARCWSWRMDISAVSRRMSGSVPHGG